MTALSPDLNKVQSFSLLNKLPGIIGILEPILNEDGAITDFRQVLMNAAMVAALGMNADNVPDGSLLTLYPLAKQAGFFDRLVTISEDGQPQRYETDFELNGTVIWIDVSLVRIDSNILVHCYDITDRKRMEIEMARRLELESIVSSVSSRLINISIADLDDCIMDALRQIGTFNQADRVSVCVYSNDQRFFTCLYEWCAPGIESQWDYLHNRPVNASSWWRRTMRTDQLVGISTLDDLPPEASDIKAGLKAQGVLSVLGIPLQFDSNREGVMGFVAVRQERRWDDKDVALLKTFGEIITSALKRRQNEEAAQRTHKRLLGLQTIDKALLESSLTNEHPVVVALRHIYEMIPCQRMVVFRIDHVNHTAHVEARITEGQIEVQPTIMVPIHFFYHKDLLAGKFIQIRDINPDNAHIPPGLNLHQQGFRSLVLIPLFSQQQYIGAFILLANTPHFFSSEHLQVAEEVASQLSIALYQQQLRHQIKQHTELLEQRVAERTAEISQLSTLKNAILEHAGLAIISTDKFGLVKTINPAAEKLLGYRADELIDKIYPRLQSEPDTSVKVLSYDSHKSAHAGLEPEEFKNNLKIEGYNLECVLVSKDGRRIPALLTTTTLRDETGMISGYVGMATDITALKDAKAELQRKNQELETFFGGSHSLNCIADAEGRLLKINDAWASTLGYQPGELLGRSLIDLIHPDDQKVALKGVSQVTEHIPLSRSVQRIRKKDGSYCIIEWNAIVHNNLMYGSARDITQQHEAEEQLRNLNQRLQLATLAAVQGIWEYDPRTGTLHWDERQHQIYGSSPATFGRTFDDFLTFLHPEDRETMVAIRDRVVKVSGPVVGEVRAVLPDGSIRYVEGHSQAFFGVDGLPEKVVGVCWDITERKNTELALRQSEERYRSLVNNLKETVYEVNLDGVWTFLNPAWEDTTGYPVEECLGQPITLLVNPDEYTSVQKLFRTVLDQKMSSFVHVMQYRHRDGSYHWAEVLARVTLSDDGQPTGITGSITDITEQKQALDALRESDQRFREIADNVDEVFWIHSSDPFKLLYVNPAYERVWGQSCQSLYDNPSTYIDPILDEDKPALFNSFVKYQNGQEGSTQYRLRGKDGSIKWINARNFIIKDTDGNPLRYIGIANDITTQKENELALQQSLQREQEVNRLKTQFVSAASHEFRTPLSTIQSSVDLIKLYLERPGESSIPAIERHLGIIENEISAFNDLLADMLTIGRLDAGKIPFAPELTDVRLLVEEVIATHFLQRKDNRRVELHIVGPQRPIHIDKKLITHVLINLLSNAFKFSNDNPELRIVFEDHVLKLIVIDGGIGIPANDLPHLFETFFRAKNAIDIPGSGLGLLIVRQFVDLHYGKVQIQSKENEGTTAAVLLPISPCPAARQTMEEATA